MTDEQDPTAAMRNRSYVAVLAIAAVVGVIAAFAAWVFLEAIHEITHGVYDSLPDALGFDSTPSWWSLPWLVLAAYIVAFAIERMPGGGGHIPARGLDASPTQPNELPGVVLAALAGIGLGVVLGPEAPLIALGGGIGIFFVRRAVRDAPEELTTLIATAGIFAAVSFLFGSPVIAAVLLIEAAGLDKKRLTAVLIPGLLAAGLGSLVSSGMGDWTGVDTADIAFQPVPLDDFPRPDLVDFLWTIPFAAVIAIGVHLIIREARGVEAPALRRPFVVLPAIAVMISVLGIIFEAVTDKAASYVLFSGETALTPLVADASSWSVGALLLLILFKGIAYGLALGSFRGGPVFPALFIGVAAGLIAAKLPGMDMTPAVAVGMGAATVAVLRLPLSSVVLAVLLTSSSGVGSSALVILGVVVSYLVVNAMDPPEDEPTPAPGTEPAPAPA